MRPSLALIKNLTAGYLSTLKILRLAQQWNIIDSYYNDYA